MTYAIKGLSKYMFKIDEDIKELMDAIVKRTRSFFEDEVRIKGITGDYTFLRENEIKLKGLSSIISITDYHRITIVFNYEDSLLNEIFIRYTKDIIKEENRNQFYIDETARDLINNIIGNAMSKFGQSKVVIEITTPIIIRGLKYNTMNEAIKVYTTQIKTEFGQMNIYCITPGNLFLNQFCNLEENV